MNFGTLVPVADTGEEYAGSTGRHPLWVREYPMKITGTQFDPYFAKIMIRLMEERNEAELSGQAQAV